MTSAAALIREVFASGGQIRADGPDLVLSGPRPVPDHLLAQIREHKPAILDALARPLPPAAKARRQKVLAILARDSTRYAALVEDPNTDPVIVALATPDGTCDLQILQDRYDPLAALAKWEREDPEPDPLWWRVSILVPGGRTVEVDGPSGCTLPDWQAYALRYHGPECAVTAIAGLPKFRALVNLDEALVSACEAWRASLRRNSGR